MSEKLKQRSEISDAFKWDIEAMFPDESVFERSLEEVLQDASAFQEKYTGHTADSAKVLLQALKMRDEMFLKLEDCLVYAHMKKDEDNRVSKYVGMYDKACSVYAKASASLSFFMPELLSAPEERILSFLDEEPELRIYEFALRDALREKEHILSEKEENILAQLCEVTSAPQELFTMLNNAEMKFGMVRNDEGEQVELSHGNYSVFLESHDREVRKDAYTHLYQAFRSLNHTIATAYNYNVKNDAVHARIRKYSSSRAMALAGGNIREEVYDNLISVVHEYLPVLHRYIGIRKKLLGVDELKMYDVYVPLVKLPKRKIPYGEGLKIAREGLAPLGEEYLRQFDKGTKEEGWIDVYENEGKTSGAYSFGCYNSKPYVLLNYTDTLKDVFTIVHEMGHSMNSYYTRKTQPYIYGDHHIFTAEVASTVNESLLMRHLLDTETDPEMRKYLINYYIEEFRTTLFRQTMFAEFEDLTHKEVENGGVLTAEWMNQIYSDLNQQYFGPEMGEGEYIRYEWSRIPHFYNSFYVYQYATGFSAATAISKRILSEGKSAVEDYLRFLSQGTNDFPVEVLKIAGVDMGSPEPVRAAMETFKSLVEEFENLTEI